MLPSWYYTSIDAASNHGTDNLQSHSRWPTQMAFSNTLYSFKVREDTAPGQPAVQRPCKFVHFSLASSCKTSTA